MIEMPYFMTNEEWFELDDKKKCYVLTDKATDKAKESYDEYMKYLERSNYDNY